MGLPSILDKSPVASESSVLQAWLGDLHTQSWDWSWESQARRQGGANCLGQSAPQSRTLTNKTVSWANLLPARLASAPGQRL